MKVNPAGAGFDEARLERINEHIQARYIDSGRIAGCQVVVARHGNVGYFRSFATRVDRRANFGAAFEQSLEDFEQEALAHLATFSH